MSTVLILPPEVLQQILLHAHDGLRRRQFGGFESPPRRYELKGIDFRKNLSSLRLVNRAFCDLVTPLLFQHVAISFDSGIDRLRAISKSPLRRLVRRLDLCVKLRPVSGFESYWAAIEDETDEYLAYLKRLAIVIHTALPRFSEVKVLKLDFVDIPYDGIDWEENTTDLFESLATAVRRSELDKLDELDLWLPLAFDFGYFLDNEDADDCSSKPLFRRLRYLDLRYEQSTEEGEGIEFRWMYPNQEYDKYIRKLLPLAPNIRALWLQGSDALMLDRSAFSPSHRLRSLNLESLSMTGDAFCTIVHQSMETLERVVVRGVYLESGRWKKILLEMCKLPLLTHFYIETCGYQAEGESAHFNPSDLGSRPEDSIIETTESDDLDAWRALLKRLRENKLRIHGIDYSEEDELEDLRAEREEIE
ncbi:hypothetical protein NW754_002264 [Fusarium falciforme]|uniref:Uncharacterized protein n=1 Tax=Fusarium falciforme TaxID=195108 RepID=A0A9W8UU17_9HYPO|nr:hypothetical protein NW754_002264 [Fusarium falciforme]KAJ4175561.1 hypothetical protein NW767_015747 [Fusarium falciforme]KAJ4175861.1 hypothetical protein NW755_014722 [Fusarium falciforme]KAJ4212637.1 hypothetical protein NW757_014784 [Fusarium falciforme]